jgi:hypothetical protein
MSASVVPIPFRAEPAVASGQMVGVVLVTSVLLVVTFVLLAYGRKKGWLDRWLGRTPTLSAKREYWNVESQRISRQTTVHTLKRSGRTLIVVESSSSVALTSLDLTTTTPEAGNETR